METINPKTQLTHAEAREFIREHFEEFVNKKNLQIGHVNFATDFVDHGSDVPPGMPPSPAGAIEYVNEALQRFPDLHVQIEDMIAEDDKVVAISGPPRTHKPASACSSVAWSSGALPTKKSWNAGPTSNLRTPSELSVTRFFPIPIIH